MRRVIFCLLSVVVASPLAAQDTVALREELEDVVAYSRLHRFACLIAGEAYALQATALEKQPEKRALVESYRALVALELGEVGRAKALFEEARRLAPKGPTIQPAESGTTPREIRPGHTVALDDLPDRSRDVVYELYDPTIFRAEAERRARALLEKLPESPDQFDESALIGQWCRLLSDPAADAKSKGVLPGVTLDGLTPQQKAEAIALDLIRLRRGAAGSADETERGLLERPDLGVWALRAASLAGVDETKLLETARRAVREHTKDLDEGPFDPKVVRFRTKDDQARLAELLDLYWEVAWCYRGVYVKEHGAVIPQNPPLSAVRGATLAVHLANPTLRVDWDLMRIVQVAELRAYQRDLQSWQLELTDERLAEVPALAAVRYLARAVAGNIDLPTEVQILQPEDEAFSEEVEPLLIGGDEAAAIISADNGGEHAVGNAGPVVVTSRISFGFLAILALVVGGLLVAVIAGVMLFAARDRDTEERPS